MMTDTCHRVVDTFSMRSAHIDRRRRTFVIHTALVALALLLAAPAGAGGPGLCGNGPWPTCGGGCTGVPLPDLLQTCTCTGGDAVVPVPTCVQAGVPTSNLLSECQLLCSAQGLGSATDAQGTPGAPSVMAHTSSDTGRGHCSRSRNAS
jgi:hypothetical protein